MNLSSFRPVFRPFKTSARVPSATPRPTQCLQQRTPATTSQFSSTSPMQKRKKGPGQDPRITSIRYHLSHPLTPRPLHFSRNRSLRHWTIHRAWLLFLRKRRAAEQLELERQYMSMRAACEHLRLMDSHGNRVDESKAGGQGPDPGTIGEGGKDVGRLYRSAMIKRGIWGSVPVEYARLQTDYPGREGWNHGWTRN
ncbi:hypothetical protein HBH56_043020 [Parastagonospora nodorum]|uniref:Uncharacterized protein n=2 Tax=Phaeosphaeria nodorum (strain SN15 / ATCC MYA-4574 / FGSC 10173) TaxID=321614 RepID=A0A7U2HWG0_PHANO|nr:hypothetical protein SNOG_08069 [Parastagonospora nodorum SN15]KAH3917645.1 hypothetical protein HBH56_043020 [Parastagonospora nodorum]EAT84345.1 hypothetical protein SNOG_08069 [Parastagonospora nodorum SN15]KAH3933279.1 hypothetical protein HBH54_070770 [Parastagonospora nodorum]KAH4038595.1 hypothetical protein HBI09_053280 [Parastagonospora nodorum]KAH4130355.1 hypothetical protein HBH47_023230 [Parastagonospora nodorum]